MSARICLAIAAASLFGYPAAAQLPSAPQPVAGSLLDAPTATLEGRWTVMIDYGAGRGDAEQTAETLIITSASDGGLQGGFMGAPFGESAMRKDGSSTVFFTQTDNGSGPVFHSGRITGASVTGQSYFSGRKELLVWRGVREAAEN